MCPSVYTNIIPMAEKHLQKVNIYFWKEAGKKKNLANEKKKGKFLNLIRDSTTYLTASIIFNIKIMKAFLLK